MNLPLLFIAADALPCRCFLLLVAVVVIVLSHCLCLLSCIVIRLIVVLNIDPPLDRKQTQIILSYSSQQTPYLNSVKFSLSSSLLTCCCLFSLSVLSLSCIIIRMIVVFNIDPPSIRNKHESLSPNHHN